MEIFEPEGEVELSGGEIAGGDEAEGGVLDLGGKFGEGVAGVGAGDGVEFVEAELVVEGEGAAGGGGEGGVEVGGEVLRFGLKDKRADGLEGRELRRAEILCDVDGAVVDKLLKAKAGSGLGGAIWRDDVQMFRADGHDTTLLMMRSGWLTFVYLLDDGKWRKSLITGRLILPQRWYVD